MGVGVGGFVGGDKRLGMAPLRNEESAVHRQPFNDPARSDYDPSMATPTSGSGGRRAATTAHLGIVAPSIPRPGEAVLWYQSSSPLTGTLKGHRADGSPCILNSFGSISFPPSFATIRLLDASVRLGPNWERLAAGARLASPRPHEAARMDALLDQRTPPGPRYRELIEEIHARGFEVFIVGGTTRDVIAGVDSHDVDLSTTMPLSLALPLVQSMYARPTRLEPGAQINGHLRLGGAPGTSDPFIDLSVFKDTFVGTPQAQFSDGFSSDLGNRDFACNAIYYEPISQILIDPTGLGIEDAETNRLRLVCDPLRRTPRQIGQIAIRYFKFRSRGFDAVAGCSLQIMTDFLPNLAAISEPQRIHYIRTQVLSKVQRCDQRETLATVRQEFLEIGAAEAWDTLVAPFEEALLA
jgi:Poly A polymerase head domain